MAGCFLCAMLGARAPARLPACLPGRNLPDALRGRTCLQELMRVQGLPLSIVRLARRRGRR